MQHVSCGLLPTFYYLLICYISYYFRQYFVDMDDSVPQKVVLLLKPHCSMMVTNYIISIFLYTLVVFWLFLDELCYIWWSLYRLLFTETLQEGYIFGELDHVKGYSLLFLVQALRVWQIEEFSSGWNVSTLLQVYFASDEVNACIVTCGGLCPGLNTVIREIVHSLAYMYGINEVLGIDVSHLILLVVNLWWLKRFWC